MSVFTLALHAGAEPIEPGSLSPDQERAYIDGLQQALEAGYTLLANGGSALDAVERTVKSLEDNACFNAGRGATFTIEQTQQLDAAIMCGQTLQAGAVAGVENVRNPISLARAVMDRSEHVFMVGKGAEAFAREQGLLFEPDSYFFSQQRYDEFLQTRNKASATKDTVGAVALDSQGNLAVATSTGGLAMQRVGRVGDSPCIGAGTYANNRTCAVSLTGDGELILKAVAAYDVSCLIDYRGLLLTDACQQVIHQTLKDLGAEAGLVAVDASGRAELVFNTSAMFRAWRNHLGEGEVAIF